VEITLYATKTESLSILAEISLVQIVVVVVVVQPNDDDPIKHNTSFSIR
jgi:hypothetical protein